MAAPSTLFGSPTRPAGDPELRARDERLESLKAVVGKLAHDFNNFLVPQFGYITLLTEDLPPEHSGREYLKSMEKAARTTEAYIESVLLAVRPQRRYSPAPFDFAGVLREMIEQWQKELPVGLDLRLQVNIEPGEFFGDERHWRKVFEHLLANARFALASGGALNVHFQSAEITPGEMTRLGLETPEIFTLQFDDTGFGMPESARQRAFEPFFTTRPLTRGSGLGLTVVHTVTQFHGGQVELRSEEDRGTTITLWIPRSAPARARSVLSGALRQKSQTKPRALLVESEPVLREVLRAYLADLEYDVQPAESAAEALKSFERNPSAWSLIVASAVLKEGRGEEICARASQNGSTCCVLLAESADATAIQAPPGTVVLKKPFKLRSLFESLAGARRE